MVRITETVHNGARRGKYVVEIEALVLERILRSLEAPFPLAPSVTQPRRRSFITGEQCDAMKKSYLKGVANEALALIYGCKAVDIEDVMVKEGIEVVDQDQPIMNRWKKYGRRKK